MLDAMPTDTPKSPLDGLWILLVNSPGDTEATRRVPVMARAGNDETYLLGFKNVHGARRFAVESSISDAEPRMVVRGNKTEVLRIVQDAGVVGVLIDYNPATQQYSAAAQL